MQSSGEIREFVTGAVRDSAEGKPAMELLPWELLMRVAKLYGEGASKYGANNWRRGQPQDACLGSLQRHLTKYQLGMTDEDHLSAVIFNALSIMNVDEYFKDNPDLYNIQINDKIKTGK